MAVDRSKLQRLRDADSAVRAAKKRLQGLLDTFSQTKTAIMESVSLTQNGDLHQQVPFFASSIISCRQWSASFRPPNSSIKPEETASLP